ncbi:MAG: Plug domain-containing protein [Gammaproteobacteria bacterium]|nr:Plug domain-containing protein [Gammaproteobacteria bacterium]MYF59105.1 Plug domain-containing protein [Gammaproteobacteria bacterium]
MKSRLQYQTPSALTILLLAVLTVGAVRAWAQSEEVLTLDIEPQKAGSALMTLAQSSGVHIMLEEGAGARVDVEGLKGEYRFEDALAALVTDTGLKYQHASENMVVVQVVEQAAQPDGAEQAPADEDEEPLELAQQTVTGSRLRDTLSGAPVFVLTREEINLRGLGSVEDVIRSLPQNFSEVNAGAARDNSINSVDAMGQSMVNLRGFGEQSTLVLVNGRRWPQASSFGNGAVNINGLPFSAILSEWRS